jgi:tRNA 2-selenouridine synthase SelU
LSISWAGDCEFRLNTAAIEARNNIILNSREEFYPSEASHLDRESLLSPAVIYQFILNKFELLVG